MNGTYGRIELHSHLYGCLGLDELYWLHDRKEPRKEIFTESYKKCYGRTPDWELLFSKTSEGKRYLESCYYFSGEKERLKKFNTTHRRQAGNFEAFQCAFDLVISLSHTDPEELHEIALRVANTEEADFAEYRMLFSPLETESSWKEKVAALAEGLFAASRQTGKELRLAMSLVRRPDLAERQYQWLRELQSSNGTVANVLSGIDFCATEEGYPPG
ncbi:MAG: hypothetical protein D6722_23190, partial [Bacteroidetes bacterium]